VGVYPIAYLDVVRLKMNIFGITVEHPYLSQKRYNNPFNQTYARNVLLRREFSSGRNLFGAQCALPSLSS
jgi:hypothetical protein